MIVELKIFFFSNNIYGELNNQRRVGSKERPVRRQAPQPPTQKVRRSSVDVLETSHSESESPRPDQVRPRAPDNRAVNEPSQSLKCPERGPTKAFSLLKALTSYKYKVGASTSGNYETSRRSFTALPDTNTSHNSKL